MGIKRRSTVDSGAIDDAEGALRAFERFYRDNVTAVYRFAAQRLAAEDAEDVTTEVFLAAALAHRDGVGEELSRSWLIAVCRNKIIDRWRSAGRRKAKSHLVALRMPKDWTPPVDVAIDLRDERVRSALDRVSDRNRTLLVLHHVDGMPIRELAANAGLSESAIESALARARREFRRLYGEVS